MYEGVRIVVNNNLGASTTGYLMGAEALAKVHSDAPGFGPQPAHCCRAGCGQVAAFRQHRLVSPGWLLCVPSRGAGAH